MRKRKKVINLLAWAKAVRVEEAEEEERVEEEEEAAARERQRMAFSNCR